MNSREKFNTKLPAARRSIKMLSKYDTETKIWHGPKLAYPYPMDVSFGEIFLKNLRKNPDRILQIFADDDTELSCEQLRISSIRIAQHLQKIGVREDDVVGLITHHSHFATCFIHGCILVGCILNPLDGQQSEEDFSRVYGNTKPKLIVCDEEVIPKLQNALKNVDFTYRIYSSDDATSTYDSAKSFLRSTGREENFKCPKFSKPSDEKLLTILCTSGSTGKAKSACSSHANAIQLLHMTSVFAPIASRSILFSPLFWVSGFACHLAVSFTEYDTRFWTSRKFSVEAAVEMIEKYQITNVCLAPYALNTLLNSQVFLSSENECLRNFRITGAILSEEGRKNFYERLPNRILTISYGLTESPRSISSEPLEYLQGLSVGSIILPNISIKIVNDDGNALDNGQTGEICIRPSLQVLGYYNNPEATNQLADEHGFIKTGDIGYINDNGMIFVVDRKKDILKYKGMHVSPSDVENVIETIKGVETVSVVGVPDDLYGHLITAAVVKREGCESLTNKDIVDYVASKLPEFKRLSGGVYFFKELPTTLSGKIGKSLILEEILKLQDNIIIN